MVLREKILNSCKTKDEKLFVSRIMDIAGQCEKHRSLKYSFFLNGYEQVLAGKILSQLRCGFEMFGGYGQAERKIAACIPEGGTISSSDFPISVIKVSGRELDGLSHRDYLGSVLALGINREKIGDISIGGGQAYIFCSDDIGEYIISQLEKVANKGVKLSLCQDFDEGLAEKKYKEISCSVASLRLDGIIAAMCGTSRGEAADTVKRGGVSVNWESTEDTSKTLCQGDIISVKGFGRAEVSSIGSATKKGRIRILIRKYV